MSSQFQVIEPGSISEWVWDSKYRLKQQDGTPIDKTVDDTFKRVATAIAAAETNGEARDHWGARFYDAMKDFEFLPAGRILAGAGSDRDVTLCNCFVMGTIPDSMQGIMQSLSETAITLRSGGGVGMDFSTLRPKGAPVLTLGADASGPVSFMEMWDSMCRTIMSAGARRGAMMAVMRCDHPDIEEFITAKRTAGRLTNFNVSVLVTDAFMRAVENDEAWSLQFGGKLYRLTPARKLWQLILESTYEHSEPGVIFIDRVNERNPLRDVETISGTNPCGEEPLPPYGACVLGSINLARLVSDPFTPHARINRPRLEELARLAVRFLDNVINVSRFPLREQVREALDKRRIGIGVTGLADALFMLGKRYGSEAAVANTEAILVTIAREAMGASIELADERAPYTLWQESHGPRRRNSHLLSIAPTGTISLFAGNVSSGIEPVFSLMGSRTVLLPNGKKRQFGFIDYAARLQKGDQPLNPSVIVTAADLSIDDHLRMAAAAQTYVDSAISKTINCPVAITLEKFGDVYRRAYELGMKGCTTYRPSTTRGAVLESAPEKPSAAPAAEVSKPQQESGNVVRIMERLERDRVIDGRTYKIKHAGADHALYVTINDVEHDGRRRPFEVFFNSKDVDGYAWRVALSRMLSAVFRKGGDVAFIAAELKAVFDPRGGYWDRGKYVPSIAAAIGEAIEEHMQGLGLIETEPKLELDEQRHQAGAKHCPKCQIGALHRSEGCWHCTSCDYSKC